MRATVLTEEHRTYNPIERERLIREHPHEDEDIMFFDERLCGILQVRTCADLVFLSVKSMCVVCRNLFVYCV